MGAIERAMLDGLLSQPHMAVAVCDSKGTLTMLSPAMERLLEAAYSPISEPEWARTFCLQDEFGQPLGAGEDPLARVFRGEEVANEVFSVKPSHSSRRKWGLASGIILTDERQEKMGAAVFVLDITERREEQERLDELRDRLVETINHEVRTPLATISGHVEVMEERGVESLPDWAQWSIDAISRSAVRLSEVVARISELADQSQRGPRRRH